MTKCPFGGGPSGGCYRTECGLFIGYNDTDDESIRDMCAIKAIAIKRLI